MMMGKHSLNPDFLVYWYILCCFTFVNVSTDTHWSAVLCWNASIASWFLQCVPERRQYSGEHFLPEWGLSEPPGHARPPPPSPGHQLDPPLRSPPSAGCCSYRLPAHQLPATSATTQNQHFAVTPRDSLSDVILFTCWTTATVPGAMAIMEVTASWVSELNSVICWILTEHKRNTFIVKCQVHMPNHINSKHKQE